MTNDVLTREIHKRLTLNWLIQGAAQHAGMTFHHLVRDELNAVEPELLHLYDQYALINLLQYWQPDVSLLLGWPPRFWCHASTRADHPFFGHALLTKYGGKLAETGRRRALERCKEKGFTSLPVAFTVQAMFVISRLRKLEAPHRPRLIELARRTASTVWGIPPQRLRGQLEDRVVPGNDLPSRSMRDAIFRACITGLGGVRWHKDELIVEAHATNWQLLAKELVKGTAELVCLHGLNQLDDDVYHRVIDVTDRLELEPWMLQSGGELWRCLLAALPAEDSMAAWLMRLARLPVEELELLMATVIEQPELAQTRFAKRAGQTGS